MPRASRAPGPGGRRSSAPRARVAGRRAAAIAGGLAVLAAAAAAVAPPVPAFVERYYAQSFYPALQPRLTGLTNLVPFALLDALVAIALACLIVELVRGLRRPGRWWRRIARLTGRLASAGAVLYLLFLLCWGLNYRRPAAAERFDVNRARVTQGALRALADRTIEAVNATYAVEARTPTDDAAMLGRLAPALDRTRASLATWPMTPGRPKASAIGRTFPWSGVDGMINPLGLEVILNPEVLPFERPFVLAHEWAHLAGHAPEDEASFVGWLTCLAGDRGTQYSGWLGLYLHVLRALPAPERRDSLARLDPGPREDLRAIERRLAHVQPLMHEASWEMYDTYLRANRVPGGVASYDEVITLVLGSPIAWPHWRTASSAGTEAAALHRTTSTGSSRHTAPQ
jgi:hypothetical protein